MEWPQITMIVIYSLNIFLALMKHGESQGKYSFWTASIATAIGVTILYYGGFW